MRIFLDANILFSGARSDGAIRRLLALLRKAGHSVCVDDFVIEEARRNLEAKNPSALVNLDSLLSTMERLPTRRPEADLLASIPLPEKDQPVLAAAIRGGCDTLITGDRTHFGALFGTVFQGVIVYSPAQAAEALL
jgi:predicted nucleic acid-binding protein